MEKPAAWYFNISVLVIALLLVGPLALPLLWFNPRFSRKNKILITILVLVATYFSTILMVKSIKSITEYYNMLLEAGSQ